MHNVFAISGLVVTILFGNRIKQIALRLGFKKILKNSKVFYTIVSVI